MYTATSRKTAAGETFVGLTFIDNMAAVYGHLEAKCNDADPR